MSRYAIKEKFHAGITAERTTGKAVRFRPDGALVRHGRAALLPGREILLGLKYLGALQMADFGRQPLDRRGDHGQGGEEHRVAVARDDLGRNRLGNKAELGGDMSLDLGRDVGEGADRAEIAQVATSSRAALRRARLRVELGKSLGQLEAKVTARLDYGCPIVRSQLCSSARRLQTARSYETSRSKSADCSIAPQGGVEDVGDGHALVQPAPLGPISRRPGEEAIP